MELPLKCKECPKSFNLEQSLTAHVNFKHKKTFRCKTCQEVFPSDVDLIRHRQSEHVEDLAKYKTSTRHFQTNEPPSEDLIVSFMAKVPAAKNLPKIHLQCMECKHVVATYGAFKRHVSLKHLRIKCYNCILCDASFLVKPSLVEHNLKIHGIQPLTRKARLQRNLEAFKDFYDVDSEQNPVPRCKSCKKDFPKFISFFNHCKQRHAESSTEICDQCGKTYSKDYMVEHKRLHKRKHSHVFSEKERIHYEYFDGYVDDHANKKDKAVRLVLTTCSRMYLF